MGWRCWGIHRIPEIISLPETLILGVHLRPFLHETGIIWKSLLRAQRQCRTTINGECDKSRVLMGYGL
ncbi:MAG: hypothetical protein ABJM12_03045, partial [Ekhidna sp.]